MPSYNIGCNTACLILIVYGTNGKLNQKEFNVSLTKQNNAIESSRWNDASGISQIANKVLETKRNDLSEL